MIVIFKDAFGFHMTSYENYNSRIQDANKITTLNGFNSVEEIEDYLHMLYPQEVIVRML
jgi:hypothetical protein